MFLSMESTGLFLYMSGTHMCTEMVDKKEEKKKKKADAVRVARTVRPKSRMLA